MNRSYSIVGQRSSSALATNNVLRNTSLLLSLMLLFNGLTAGLSIFLNMPPMTYLVSVIGGMVIAMFVLPRFANSTAGIGIVFLITGLLGFGLEPMLTMYASLPNGGNIITLSLAGTGAIFMGLSAYALATRKRHCFSKTSAVTALLLALSICVPPSLALAENAIQPEATPPGEPKTTKTKMLEAGARLLQGTDPLKKFDIYLVGFHPMKDHPETQMEAHHYCHQLNEDFAQCALFDGNTEDANLTGIEYIISEKLFATLPEEEKKYWHPHNGEILSGQLIAPNIPDIAEKELMKEKMNSYGKTWHVWNTGFYQGKSADLLPLGDPMLGWSFNRDGEATPGLVEERDRKMDVNTVEIRRKRNDLHKFANPQSGVDDLRGKFGRPFQDIPGVVDKESINNQSGGK